ncbi:hypothetical protein ACRPK8_04455 [Exiguobacterium sp. TDN 0502]|uniref:hypothetical protein n=1 Tax=Exiguobacterium sp. TDN 0502 TaxID=3420731 RepID=UPI003D786FFA
MIFPINGKVRHQLTIDPTVWIFDERKVAVEKIGQPADTSEQEAYYAKMGAAWDKGIMEGSRTDHNRPMTRAEKEAALQGSFAMSLAPFIRNAELLPDATAIRFEGEEIVEVPLEQLNDIYLQFSKDGKVLTDGPVYLLHGQQVIKSVHTVTVL